MPINPLTIPTISKTLPFLLDLPIFILFKSIAPQATPDIDKMIEEVLITNSGVLYMFQFLDNIENTTTKTIVKRIIANNKPDKPVTLAAIESAPVSPFLASSCTIISFNNIACV